MKRQSTWVPPLGTSFQLAKILAELANEMPSEYNYSISFTLHSYHWGCRAHTLLLLAENTCQLLHIYSPAVSLITTQAVPNRSYPAPRCSYYYYYYTTDPATPLSFELNWSFPQEDKLEFELQMIGSGIDRIAIQRNVTANGMK